MQPAGSVADHINHHQWLPQILQPDLDEVVHAPGLRVIKIENGKIREVGAFIDQAGIDLWGVGVFTPGAREYVAASDRDVGLYIFRYTGWS